MNDAIDTLRYSAALVKRWGQTPVSDGKTLSSMLVVDGISLWEVVAPVLAAFYLPKALARETPPSLFSRLVRPYLSWVKNRTRTLLPFRRGSKGCDDWPSEPTCLFLGFSGYMYRDILQPLTHPLAENPCMNHVALHDEGRFQGTAVKLHGSGVQSIWQHWTPQSAANESSAQGMISTVIRHLNDTKALPELVSDEQRPLWPRLENIFKWLWMVYLPSLMPYLALTRHILEEHRPAVIVSPDVADPRTRLFCLAGRLMGIPSLEIQFGMYSAASVEWQFFIADRVAVWGEQAHQVLLGQDVPEERITIAGSPRFDGLTDIGNDQVSRFRSRLGIPDGQIMVLFASQYASKHYSEIGDYPGQLMAVKRAVFQAVDRIEGVHLIVKPHPLETVRETKLLAAGCRKVIFMDPSDDIRELIGVCDVFITLGSTATMDALVARKLVLFPSFPGLVWWDDMYLKSDVAIVLSSETELGDCLLSIVNGHGEMLLNELEPARQTFLRNWLYRTDGQAAFRIASLAKRMAGIDGGGA